MAQGSVSKHVAKDGTVSYRVRVDAGTDPVTGTRKRPLRTFRTRREAEAGLAQWLYEIEQGTAVAPSKQTLGAYLVQWLDTTARRRNEPTTLKCYESLIRTRILPGLGALPLQALKPAHIEQFYGTQVGSPLLGRHRGTLSARMVRLMHAVLHKALKDAERLGLIAFNPADRVSPPRAPRPAIQTWDEEHLGAFLRVVEHDHYGPIWLVALATGMREGELLALRWRNVDLDEGTIAVREIVSLIEGELRFRPRTKTGKPRLVHIDPGTAAILRAWRVVQLERRVAAAAWEDRDLVFPNEAGGPVYARNLLRHFDLVQARAGVPRIRFHDLRHTSASVALRRGVDVKVVSERLGHAGIRITYDTYVHVGRKTHAEAAAIIGRALAGG